MERWTARRGLGAAALAVVLVAPELDAQPYGDGGLAYQEPALSARVWVDRGEEPVLQRGDLARIYYRSSHDAFVAIGQIDTNGSVRLLFPNSPDENHFVRGGRDYRLLFPRSPYWQVGDDPGVGYLFVIASREPFDFSALAYSHYAHGWDVSAIGRQVYQDPYVAMDDWVAALIPDWEQVPYALDFVTYHVGERYEYPRFLCYDCHGFRPFYSWNPYHHSCSQFRVVIFDDPYYYPITRYRGARVVYTRPAVAYQPRFAFKERAVGEPATPMIRERGTVPGLVYPGRRSTSGIGSGGASPSPRSTPAVRGEGVSGGEGGVQRRGGAVEEGQTRLLPGRRPTGGTGGEAERLQLPLRRPSIQDEGERRAVPDSRTGRPVLERRPPGGEGTKPGVDPGGRVRPSDPARRPSGSGGATARPAREPQGRGSARPTTKPGGSVRPPARESGSSSGARRPSGGADAKPPPPPVRRPGGGGTETPERGGADPGAPVPIGELQGPPRWTSVPLGEAGRRAVTGGRNDGVSGSPSLGRRDTEVARGSSALTERGVGRAVSPSRPTTVLGRPEASSGPPARSPSRYRRGLSGTSRDGDPGMGRSGPAGADGGRSGARTVVPRAVPRSGPTGGRSLEVARPPANARGPAPSSARPSSGAGSRSRVERGGSTPQVRPGPTGGARPNRVIRRSGSGS